MDHVFVALIIIILIAQCI